MLFLKCVSSILSDFYRFVNDFEYFYKHLLQTYKNNYGCEWDNIEKIHIDHVIPLAAAHTEEDVKKLCHYTNLQLLKEKDNLYKGANV